ncbi:uncharacterized protein LOC111404737 [Olea europaea var. sylvestris]|uniref:uncharacterized protein LOC111404737 n=1 Tax=Olea europaea var. sylvestris TaxID=158386 RepID=UPI000C1D0E70|nr:uncharacterized protein LOC111404737 [Olea europaea var. sylvestris]
MVAEIDLTMEEYIRRGQVREIQYTYLGLKIQNELILILAREARSAIVAKVKHAKYFSVILSCTPYASHEEQMSLPIRCVDNSINSSIVQEYWIEFLKYKLVNAINTVSKFFQAKDMDIDEIIKLLRALILFLEKYREYGFISAIDEAKQMASEMGIEHSDNIGDDLYKELTVLKCYLSKETKRAIDVLNYLKKMNGCFQNACVAYKILLTILVTSASSERKFFKLKLIKTYL